MENKVERDQIISIRLPKKMYDRFAEKVRYEHGMIATELKKIVIAKFRELGYADEK